MKIKFAIEAEMEITRGNALIEGKEREFIEDFARTSIEEIDDYCKVNHYPVRVSYIDCDYRTIGNFPLLARDITAEDAEAIV